MYTGELIRLRAYEREDIERARLWLNDPELRRNMMPGVPFPILPHDEDAWFSAQSFLNAGEYSFAVEALESGAYIGGCGVHRIDWKNRHACVGIFIGDPDHRGRGFGTDAMQVLTRFAFREMNLRKVILEVYEFNEPAIRSYRKCGFSEEARLREELFREGRYHDIIRMSLFRRDAGY